MNLIDMAEVAEMMGLSKRHIANLKKRKVLPYYQYGRVVRFRKEDVLAHIEQNTLTSKIS